MVSSNCPLVCDYNKVVCNLCLLNNNCQQEASAVIVRDYDQSVSNLRLRSNNRQQYLSAIMSTITKKVSAICVCSRTIVSNSCPQLFPAITIKVFVFCVWSGRILPATRVCQQCVWSAITARSNCQDTLTAITISLGRRSRHQ